MKEFDKLVEDTFAGTGGTLWQGDPKKNGYLCSLSAHGISFPMPRTIEALRSRVQEYMESKKKDIDLWFILGRQLYVGAWVNEGIVYLDLNVWMKDMDLCLVRARAGKQKAIWDIENQKEIPV